MSGSGFINYQDPLYTNKFTSDAVLHAKGVVGEQANFPKRLSAPIENFHNNDFNRKYVNQQMLGLAQSANKNYPYDTRKHVRPTISPAIRDIFDNKYNKFINTEISIDSRDRDEYVELDNGTFVYIPPNNYQIFLNHEFKNVLSIRLVELQFCDGGISAINSLNNNIAWYRPDGSGNVVTYMATIPPGNYNTTTLAQEMEKQMNMILHQSGELYTVTGTPHCFTVQINGQTQEVNIINRIEKLPIISLTSTKSANTIDFIIPFSGGAPPVGCDSTFPFFGFQTELNIIPTDFPDIGGINGDLINNKEYPFVATGDPDLVGERFYRCDSFSGGYVYTLYLVNDDGADVKALVTETITDLAPAKVGRGLSYLFSDPITNSILPVLGWPSISENRLNSLNGQATTPTPDAIQQSPIFQSMRLQLVDDGSLVFKPEPYIFMRIRQDSKPADKIANNLIKASSDTLSNEVDRAVNLFAKINVNPISGNLTLYQNENGNQNHKIFYESLLVTLNNLIIEFVDRNGNLLDLKGEHNFTLEIIEKIEVLKETQINSRTGSANRVGHMFNNQHES